MVFVDPKTLGYQPYWERWLSKLPRPPEDVENLVKHFEVYVPPSLALILEGLSGVQQGTPLRTIISQTALNMVSPDILNWIVVPFLTTCTSGLSSLINNCILMSSRSLTNAL